MNQSDKDVTLDSNAAGLLPVQPVMIVATVAEPSLAEMTANDKWKEAITGIIGLVPEVGGAASKIVAFLWPSSEANPLDTWNSIKKYAESFMLGLIDEKIAEERIKELDKRLMGIRNIMQSYDRISMKAPSKKEKFVAVLTQLENEEHFFLEKRNPERTLVYFLAYATIQLSAMRDLVGAYETIFGGKDPDAAENHKTLVAKIAEYTKHLHELAADALNWRMNHIKMTSERSSGIMGVIMWTCSDSLDKSWRPVVTRDKGDALYKFENHRAQVKAAFSAEIDAMIETSYLWPYLDPRNIKKTRPVPVVTKIGPFGGRNGTPFSRAPASNLTEVQLFTDQTRLCGLKFFYDNLIVVDYGTTVNIVPSSLKFEAGEFITKAHGWEGDTMDALYFTTNKGRTIGGGGKGGTTWQANAPLNKNARLVAAEGKKHKNGIEGITLFWQYMRNE